MANSYEDLKDIAAETTIISTLLNHPEFILHSDNLKTEHFTQRENSAIYWAIGELYKKGITKIDTLNINNQLASNKAVTKLMSKCKLNDVSRLVELSTYAARDSLQEYLEFCNTLIDLSYKRKLFVKSGELQRLCFIDTKTVEETDRQVHQTMNDLTAEYVITSDLNMIGDQCDELFDKLLEDQESDSYSFLSKFKCFEPYWIYEPGECIVLSARMKSGKSAFILNEAIYQASKGIVTFIVDTELSHMLWYKRALCHLTGIEFRRIRDGHWTEDELKKLKEANKYLKTLPIIHTYMPVIDLDKTYAMCKVLKDNAGLQFLCFDYLKDNNTDAFAQSNKLGEMTNKLKNEVAGGLELAVLAACQLNRANDIAGSDKIAMYASTVVRWRFKTSEEIREDGGLKYGNVYAQIYYNRNGAMQDKDEWMSLNFNGSIMLIEDCSQPVNEDATPFEEGGT